MKKLIIIIVSLLSSNAFSANENMEFKSEGMQSLNIRNTSGDVNVSVVEDGKAYVVANKINFEKNCNLKMEKVKSELVVKVEKQGWFGKNNCEVNFEIKIPKAMALYLKSGSGDFVVSGTKGIIDFKLGSGNVKIDADVDNLNGKIGSGSIEVSGLAGDVDLKAGSGNVSLKYRTVPTKGEAKVKTGSGETTLYFPALMKILTEYNSGSGRVNNEFGDAADAKFKVSVKSGSGDLNIKKLN